jgi:hypothetical protein
MARGSPAETPQALVDVLHALPHADPNSGMQAAPDRLG